MAVLSSCGVCQAPISCVIPPKSLVITKCFHIFCARCLKQWVNSPEKPCPMCRTTVIQKRSGKDFKTIFNIFLKIFKKNPQAIIDALVHHEKSSDICCNCLEEFPSTHLFFNPETKKLHHHLCHLGNDHEITVRNIVDIVRDYTAKNEELKEILTPLPLTFFERLTHYFNKKFF